MKETEENIDSEELATEEFEEEEPAETPKTKRIYDMDAEDMLVKTMINFPKATLKELSKVCVEKGIAKGALIRQLVNEYLAEQKKPSKEKENPEETVIDDSELTELLESCRTYWGGFKITDSDGFFKKFKAKGWEMQDLTDRQFYDVCEWLKMGYRGFAIAPSVDDFLGWVKVHKPSKEQMALLKLWLEHGITIDESDKEKTIAELTAEINELIEREE